MSSAILQISRWYLSLGAKLARVVPIATAAVIVATLISQVSMVLAYFLPLKVILLLGAEDTPRYFPEFLAAFDRNRLILGLSIAAVVSYGTHLTANRAIKAFTEYGARRLLAKSHKMVLLDNQEDVATVAYRRYLRAVAGGTFIILALIGLTVLYRELSILLPLYLIAGAAVIPVIIRLKLALVESVGERLPLIAGTLSGVGFLIIFSFLVADFIIWTPPGLIAAIVSLLLVRQVLARFGQLVSDLFFVYSQKPYIDALFFHGCVFVKDRRGQANTMWSVLMPEQRDIWIKELLREFGIEVKGKPVYEFIQLGLMNVVALRVRCEQNNSDWIVKLFTKRRSAQAIHEATLLAAAPHGLPAPELIGSSEMAQFQCNVFKLEPGVFTNRRVSRGTLQSVAARVSQVVPPGSLKGRYERSHPMLWQRLDGALIRRLRIASTSEEDAQLDALIEKLPLLALHLKSTPRVIYNPDIKIDTLVHPYKHESFLLHWGSWSIEPLGAGWPTEPKALKTLLNSVTGGDFRYELRSRQAINRVELAAFAYALEQACNRHRFADALVLLPQLLERLQDIDEADRFAEMWESLTKA